MEIYQLNQIEAGLIYLPFGIGCAVTALLTGEISSLSVNT